MATVNVRLDDHQLRALDDLLAFMKAQIKPGYPEPTRSDAIRLAITGYYSDHKEVIKAEAGAS